MKYTQNQLLLIWLDSFIGLEYHKKRDFYQKLISVSSIKQAVSDNKTFLVQAFGESIYNTILNSANQEYFDFILKRLNDKNISAITFDSENYPEDLNFTQTPPLVLYAKGDISLLKGEKFGMVGSRKSLPLSIKLAENYTEKLCDAGFTVVTGIASGIDEAVLKSALSVNGKCISVVAGGFDNVYPKSNQNLLEKVAESSLILSEYPPDVAPMPYFFPVRNRIISGLSKGILIVSGAQKSGTLYTAEYAFEYGKDVFAIPYNPGIESGSGCNDLIKRGAILTDSFKDILEYYGLNKEQGEIELTDKEKELVNLLSEGNTHIDKICYALNKQIYEIMPILSVLEIKGVVVKSGVNTYSLITSHTEA